MMFLLLFLVVGLQAISYDELKEYNCYTSKGSYSKTGMICEATIRGKDKCEDLTRTTGTVAKLLPNSLKNLVLGIGQRLCEISFAGQCTTTTFGKNSNDLCLTPSEQDLPYNEAVKDCERNGGRLYVPDSDDELNRLIEVIGGVADKFWLGGGSIFSRTCRDPSKEKTEEMAVLYTITKRDNRNLGFLATRLTSGRAPYICASRNNHPGNDRNCLGGAQVEPTSASQTEATPVSSPEPVPTFPPLRAEPPAASNTEPSSASTLRAETSSSLIPETEAPQSSSTSRTEPSAPLASQTEQPALPPLRAQPPVPVSSSIESSSSPIAPTEPSSSPAARTESSSPSAVRAEPSSSPSTHTEPPSSSVAPTEPPPSTTARTETPSPPTLRAEPPTTLPPRTVPPAPRANCSFKQVPIPWEANHPGIAIETCFNDGSLKIGDKVIIEGTTPPCCPANLAKDQVIWSFNLYSSDKKPWLHVATFSKWKNLFVTAGIGGWYEDVLDPVAIPCPWTADSSFRVEITNNPEYIHLLMNGQTFSFKHAIPGDHGKQYFYLALTSYPRFRLKSVAVVRNGVRSEIGLGIAIS